MDILDDMGVSKLSAKVYFLKVNYPFNTEPKNTKQNSFYDVYFATELTSKTMLSAGQNALVVSEYIEYNGIGMTHLFIFRVTSCDITSYF